MTEELREDIAAAKSRMRVKVGSGREIKHLPEHLWDNERVDRLTSGAYGGATGLLVLTDRRLLFIKEGMMAKKSEDFPISKVSSVQWSSGMIMGTITIFASGNKAEVKNVNKEDGKEMVDLIRGRLAEGASHESAPAPAPAASPPPSDSPPASAAPDVMEQLRKLGDLKDAGILTDEEFAAKKAELLRRL